MNSERPFRTHEARLAIKQEHAEELYEALLYAMFMLEFVRDGKDTDGLEEVIAMAREAALKAAGRPDLLGPTGPQSTYPAGTLGD